MELPINNISAGAFRDSTRPSGILSKLSAFRLSSRSSDPTKRSVEVKVRRMDESKSHSEPLASRLRTVWVTGTDQSKRGWRECACLGGSIVFDIGANDPPHLSATTVFTDTPGIP